MIKPTKEEIKAQLDFLKELEHTYWENQITGLVFHIMGRQDEQGTPVCTSVIVTNFDGVPEEYIEIPNGEYSPREYERLLKTV